MEYAASNSLGGYAFTGKCILLHCPWGKVAQNAVQYSLHHMTYALVTFGVAVSDSLGEDAFTSNVF